MTHESDVPQAISGSDSLPPSRGRVKRMNPSITVSQPSGRQRLSDEEKRARMRRTPERDPEVRRRMVALSTSRARAAKNIDFVKLVRS
jgi:hypothetical protein